VGVGNGRVGLVKTLDETGMRSVLMNGMDTPQLIPEEQFLQEFQPVPRNISRNMYSESRSHSRAFGPGGEGFEIPHVKHQQRRAYTTTCMWSENVDSVNWKDSHSPVRSPQNASVTLVVTLCEATHGQ
jgi:hypothetical protein